MDKLLQSALNKVKGFASNTLKAAQPAIQNYATAYGKVSPYVPFLPTIQTPQQVQQNWKNIGNTYNKLPSPVKKFGEGFVESNTANLYDMPAPPSKDNWDRAGYIGGFAAGMINPLNPMNKVFGAMNLGQKLAIPALGKVAPKATGFIAKKLLPNVAGEIGQTAGYMGLKGISEQVGLSPKNQGGFGEQLAYGLLGRGAFGLIGKKLPQQLRAQAGKLGDDDVKAIGSILKRAESNWMKDKKIDMKQYTKDIDLVDDILINKYGATVQELKKIPEIDRVKNLFSMAMEDYRGFPGQKSALVSNIAEQPSFKVKATPDGKIKVTPQTPELKQPTIKAGSLQESIDYARKNIKKEELSIRSGQKSTLTKVKEGISDFKRNWVERYTPLLDPEQKILKSKGIDLQKTELIDDQITRVLMSDTTASRYLKDMGFEDAIKSVDDHNMLSEYLKAKRNIEIGGKYETGRDLVKDQQLVRDLSPKYEAAGQKILNIYRENLKKAMDNGLIKRDVGEKLLRENPDYVRFERVFEVDPPGKFKSKGVASISKSGVLQKMKGSEREIKNPIQSLVDRTYKLQNEIERNKAAQMIIKYADAEGNPYGLRKLGAKEIVGDKSTISFLRNGIKEIWEVNKSVADSAKNLSSEQMPSWAKIITAPMRLFKASTTTLRIPFLLTNVARDQLTAFINSSKGMKTSLMNPMNTFRAMFESIKHGDTFKEMERSGAMGTSFDIYRENSRVLIDEIASRKNIGSRVLYKITHPAQLLRSYENILSRGEEFTRIQQYKGTLDALIKDGVESNTAKILATRAARQNTADFARAGELARVMNWFIPYFSAGIAGARSLVRAGQRDPMGTGAKLTSAVFLPMIASTIWNTSTPDRKEAYDDISDYEKENNFIFVPSNPTKDERGRWNVYKIPITPGLSNLANVSRMLTLQGLEYDKVSMKKIATDLIGAGTSVDLDNVSNFLPLVVKGPTEIAANKNLFTGKDIVPSSMKNLPPKDQAYPWTSGTIRKISEKLNVSPLQTEHIIKTYGGGSASDIIGSFDKVLASKGVIPQSQAQGMDPLEATAARFTKAQGGETKRKLKEELTKGWNNKLVAAYDYIHSPKSLDENGLPATNRNESMAFAQIRLANPQILAREAQEARLRSKVEGTPINPLYELPFDKQRVVLTLSSLPPGQDKTDLQKANIEWLKQYWAQSSVYFDQLKKSGITISSGSRGPQPSEYVQAQMDAKNWSDPQVRAYLDANLAYKNSVREELGLTPLSSGGYSKFGSYTKKPKKIAIKGVKKAKLSKFKVKAIKTPKLKALKKTMFKVAQTKQPKIKVKMPKLA